MRIWGPWKGPRLLARAARIAGILRRVAGRPAAAHREESWQAWIPSCAIEDHLSSGARMNASLRTQSSAGMTAVAARARQVVVTSPIRRR